MSLLGAVLYVLVWAKSWQDLKTFESIRHLIISIPIGYIYSILVSNYSFPDLIMCMIAGYTGVDFIQALIERFKQK
jgi:hypothetical protein